MHIDLDSTAGTAEADADGHEDGDSGEESEYQKQLRAKGKELETLLKGTSAKLSGGSFVLSEEAI